MSKKTYIALSILVVIAIGVGTVLILRPIAKAQLIPSGVYFSQVKKLSKGTKPQCLTDNAAAETAIKKIKDPKNYGSSFSITVNTAILDMPAGYTTTTVHSFDGKTATGTNSFTDKNQRVFAGDLDAFNYVVRLNPVSKEWTLTSYIACK